MTRGASRTRSRRSSNRPSSSTISTYRAPRQFVSRSSRRGAASGPISTPTISQRQDAIANRSSEQVFGGREARHTSSAFWQSHDQACSSPTVADSISLAVDEDCDSLQEEVIMAIDLRDGATMGCAYFATADGLLFLSEDIPAADTSTAEQFVLHCQPTTLLVSARAPEHLLVSLEKLAAPDNVEGLFFPQAGRAPHY